MGKKAKIEMSFDAEDETELFTQFTEWIKSVTTCDLEYYED